MPILPTKTTFTSSRTNWRSFNIRVAIPGTDVSAAAFYFTSLLATAPKLLNVESDDYGVIEKRNCGCLLEEVGYRDHLLQIRSFAKLTGEGGTLIGSELVRLLEEVLPARFGGSPLNYQFVEEEDATGFTRLSLIVDPSIPIPDERTVIDIVLAGLAQTDMSYGRGSFAAEMTRGVWRQAGTLRVKRTKPLLSKHGKLMPLHLSRRKNAWEPLKK